MSSWRKAPLVAVIALTAFLVIHLSIPATRVGTPERPERFGWQMFSISVPAPEFRVVTKDGEQDVALDDYMARVRGDIDVVALLPPHLCEVVEGAVSVEWDGGSREC